ncbi:ABC transporter permease [Dyadobacter arcticus]|uniref:ABC transport system permease protein n=1 Tax=Dyadobacter arcticus TaxID=1078754 RepID=A0ABX0UIK1_9BACT|nr:ABC transporter permease [Dyadobacter arcticus]NIJ51864.1 putative ABC transport system permease protein [Dyadobacter arcticus]
MFKNFLKITVRHFWRTRLYVCINVSGLAIGSACLVLAALYISDETSFDNFHQNNPNLYRITTSFTNQGKVVNVGGTGQVQGPAFKEQVPEILAYNRIMGGDIHGDVRSANNAFKLRMLFTDDNFFAVFTFKMLRGDARSALKNINSVVLTKKTALKLFNRLNIVGQVLQMDADPSAIRIRKPLVISGVVDDPPVNSSIQFDILFPFRFLQVSFEDQNWLNAYLGTFVVLHPSSDLRSIISKFDQIHSINAKDQLVTASKSGERAPKIYYGLQRITDIHLNPQEVSNQNREAGIINGSKPLYSYIFFGIAVFVLLMASINFINISIANSMKRAREVGIRKTTGSNQAQILFQFLGEPAFLNIVALTLAIILTIPVLPVFNQLSGKQINISDIFSQQLLMLLFAILLFNTVVSGLYPAYMLSKLSPVEVLYQRIKLSGLGGFGRGLVVFQFVVAILLGIATFVFYAQMRFVEDKDLGYSPSQIIKIGISGVRDVERITENFRNELENDPHSSDLSLVGEFGFRDAKINDRKIFTYYRTVDDHYLNLLDIKLKEGRNFSSQFPSDKKYGALVNEAFVRAAGLTDPIGKQFLPDSHFGSEVFTIVGVVKNFHYSSLRDKIQPMILLASEQYGGDALWVKNEKSNSQESLAHFENIYKKVLPATVFDYSFLDEQNALDYQQELRLQKMITIVTALSVFICCLGLFALAHLSTTQRARETGIRIVLGATVSSILVLFSKDFLIMIGIAILIAFPVGFYVMNAWLESFAYRIEVPAQAFILSGGFAILIALLTVSSQAFKAALVNPARSLRSE